MSSFTGVNNSNKFKINNQWIPSIKFNNDRIVEAEDMVLGSEYKGHQYRVIEKRERHLSTPGCIGRGFIEVLGFVYTLFLGLFSKENIRFGVLVPPYSNISSQIAASISITSSPISQPPQKAKHVKPLLPIDISSYETLRKEMRQKEATLYVTDKTGKHAEKLLGVLGCGGSKKAFQIAKGRALIFPNMDVDPTGDIARRWERMVLEEVKMSQILNKLGLLTPLSEKVNVTFTESSAHVIPAYVSETFENLGVSKGWFIIDTKNANSSTWKREEHSLFQSEEERLIEKNWESVFDSALTDIAKICLYDIPAFGDSLNIAVVKKASDSVICQYQVRYFGFDFSSKNRFLTIPDERRPSNTLNIDKATRLLNIIIDNVFFYEFGQRYSSFDESANLRNLKDQLVQRFIKEVAERMSS